MTAFRNRRFLRMAGLCGVLAPVVCFGLIFYAISISPWFSWQTDALSDLGVYPRPSALWFNVALIAAGLLNVVLVLGIGHWLGPGWLGRAGTAVALVGVVALGLIGVFPDYIRSPHWIAAATYFLVTPFGYALLGAELWRKGRRAHGAAVAATALGAFLVMLYLPRDGLAVPEMIAGLLLSGPAFSTGIKLWLEGER